MIARPIIGRRHPVFGTEAVATGDAPDTERFRPEPSLGYGDADLERFGLDGDTKMLLARLQWIY